MAVKKDQNPKLRIKLKSYDVRMLESAVGKVISLLIKSGAQVKGPIPLPKKRKVYTVAMEEGLRFAIREGGRTVGAGSVTKLLG